MVPSFQLTGSSPHGARPTPGSLTPFTAFLGENTSNRTGVTELQPLASGPPIDSGATRFPGAPCEPLRPELVFDKQGNARAQAVARDPGVSFIAGRRLRGLRSPTDPGGRQGQVGQVDVTTPWFVTVPVMATLPLQ